MLTTNVPFPTADNTFITVDTINFTADGACLSNGGGTTLVNLRHTKNPNATDSAYLRF